MSKLYVSPLNLVGPIQSDLLGHLLHPKLLKRFEDQSFYNGTLSLNEYLTILTDTIINDSIFSKSNVFKQSLQRQYVSMILTLLTTAPKQDSFYASLLYTIQNIKDHNTVYFFLRTDQKAHRASLLNQISRFEY